ncbi:MAG: tetratricopeptide repeat protein [Gemmatimonadaceae bacterium]
MTRSSTLIALLLTLAPASTVAQSPDAIADGDICSGAVDTRSTAGRESLSQALRNAQGARAAFLRACDHALEGRVEPAVQGMEAAVRGDPNNPVYHFWLGRAYGEQAETASKIRLLRIAGRAKAAFERSVALAPDYLDGREGLMQYYLQAPGIAGGSVAHARAQAREIARRNPYRGAIALAAVERRNKDAEALVRAYESAIAQFPDSVAPYTALIAALTERKDWTRAWNAVERLERARPDWRPARYTFGRVAALSGQRLDVGERYLREYLTREPEKGQPSHAGAHWRLGMILEHRGDRAGARREYQEAVRLDPTLTGARQALTKLGS